MTLLSGIDLAWRSERNGTGIAFGLLQHDQLLVTDVATGLVSLDAVLAKIDRQDSLQGLAIDAPLIIRNASGQRPCERLIGAHYGARKASCHTSNLRLYPDASSVRLSQALETRGFAHLGASTGKWQLECYPHPAIIEIFGLKERHAYKKGRVAGRRAGQRALARYIAQLAVSPVLPLLLASGMDDCLSEDRIHKLCGAALKHNEDLLDALICLYVAGLYAKGLRARVFGDTQDGYVYVPDLCCTG